MLKHIPIFIVLITLFCIPRCAIADGLVNDPTTGTQVNKLAKLTATSTVIVTSAGDTSGAIGLCVAGCGTTGSPIIQVVGYNSCVFDGPTIANDYVQQSATVAGDCHDAGPPLPISGQIIGIVLFTHATAGTYTISLKL